MLYTAWCATEPGWRPVSQRRAQQSQQKPKLTDQFLRVDFAAISEVSGKISAEF